MINLRIFGLASVLGVVVTSIFVVTTSQNAIASILDEEADVDVAEATEVANATMTNQPTANYNMTDVQFLFIQRAQSGSISQINETAYTLELNNVSDSTILFADRLNRIVETVSTSDFVGNWSAGQDSFAADAPNDALIVEDIQTGDLETAVIESFSPVYDMTTNTLTYTIMTENGTSLNMPSEFGQSVLVVDNLWLWSISVGTDYGRGTTRSDNSPGTAGGLS